MTKRGKLIYVAYASGPFERNLAINAWFARHGLGADRVLLYRRADLEVDPVYHEHREIFDTPRGGGLYAWKPWFIWKALEQAGPDDVVVYHDCGAGWRYRSFLRPRALLDLARQRGFLCGVRCSHYGPNRRWISRRCLDITEVNRAAIADADTIEAAVSFWARSPEAEHFLRQWRDNCLVYDAVRDVTAIELADEDPELIEHRHDQAVLTCLAWRDGAPWIECSPPSLPFAKSVTLLELDLRGQTSWFYRLIWRAVIWFGNLRRTVRPPA